jgi:hypothetical protein
MSDDRKTELPLHLDMPFDEALRRYVQTDPSEVEPPPGKKRKMAKQVHAEQVAGLDAERKTP